MPWQQSVFSDKVKRLIVLTFFLIGSCDDRDSTDRLFKALYHRTFIPKDGVTIEFIDSLSYRVQWGPDSARKSETKTWRIESRLTGTYLIMDSSEMILENLSDSVVTFENGEFNPRFVLKN